MKLTLNQIPKHKSHYKEYGNSPTHKDNGEEDYLEWVAIP